MGPFAGDDPGPERSLHWWAFARNKRSVVLDIDAEADRSRLLDLARGADFFLESAPPGDLDRRGLGYRQLAAVNPALVYVSITPFGPDGPKAHWAATDLVVQASAGAMKLTGHPDRPPLRTGGVSAFTHAGAEAAGAALIAHHERARSGRGQHVQVSAQIAANLAAGFTWVASQIGAPVVKRSGGGVALGPVRLPWIWQVADGEVSLTLGFDGPAATFFDRFLDWMVEEGALDRESRARKWADDVRAVVAGGAPANDLASLFDRIAAFLRPRTKAELLRGDARAIAADGAGRHHARRAGERRSSRRAVSGSSTSVTTCAARRCATRGRSRVSVARRSPRAGERRESASTPKRFFAEIA